MFNIDEYLRIYSLFNKKGGRFKFNKNSLSLNLLKNGVPIKEYVSNNVYVLEENSDKTNFYKMILKDLGLDFIDLQNIPYKYSINLNSHLLKNEDLYKSVYHNNLKLNLNISIDERIILNEITSTLGHLIPTLSLIERLKKEMFLKSYNLDEIIKSRKLINDLVIEYCEDSLGPDKVLHFLDFSEGVFIKKNSNFELLNKLKIIGGIYLHSNTDSFRNLGIVEEIKNDVQIYSTCFNSFGKLLKVGGNLEIIGSTLNEISNLEVGNKLVIKNTQIKNLRNLKIENGITLNKDLKGQYTITDCIINGKTSYYPPTKFKPSKTYIEKMTLSYFTNNCFFNFFENEFYIEIYIEDEKDEIFLNYRNKIFDNNFKIDDYIIDFNYYTLLNNLFIRSFKKFHTKRIDENSLKKELLFYRELIPNDNNGRSYLDKYINFLRYHNLYDIIIEFFNWGNISLKFSLINEIELKTNKRVLTGENLINNLGVKSGLNNYTIENLEEYTVFINEKIGELYNNNYSFFKSIVGFKQSNIDHLIEFENIDKRNDVTLNKFLKIRSKYLGDYKSIWKSYNQNDLSLDGKKSDLPFIWYVENMFHEIFSSIIFNSENEFRTDRGLPKIGEGWISETNLFYQLKEYFEGIEVIHHGKPDWLGSQHVDIWFPDYKIGVEYQGLQHDEPVDFFGGEETFKKNLERDERKKRLFKENDSILIEVRPNYKLDDVVNEIKKLIR